MGGLGIGWQGTSHRLTGCRVPGLRVGGREPDRRRRGASRRCRAGPAACVMTASAAATRRVPGRGRRPPEPRPAPPARCFPREAGREGGHGESQSESERGGNRGMGRGKKVDGGWWRSAAHSNKRREWGDEDRRGMEGRDERDHWLYTGRHARGDRNPGRGNVPNPAVVAKRCGVRPLWDSQGGRCPFPEPNCGIKK